TANGGCAFLVEDRGPGQGTIRGLPHATAGGSEIVGGGITRNSGGSERAATAEWTNHPVLHALEERVLMLVFGFFGFRLGFSRFLFRGGFTGALSCFLSANGEIREEKNEHAYRPRSNADRKSTRLNSSHANI